MVTLAGTTNSVVSFEVSGSMTSVPVAAPRVTVPVVAAAFSASVDGKVREMVVVSSSSTAKDAEPSPYPGAVAVMSVV